jgi:hypothetical protein
VLAGDCEELWECRLDAIRAQYADLYALFDRFDADGGLIRLYGNHDVAWRDRRFVGRAFPWARAAPVYDEALRLTCPSGTIFLTHGHQGELFSDILWPLARFAVRHLWAMLQRLYGWSSEGPVRRIGTRNQRERHYYHWAKAKRILFIAGHTHRAMFGSHSKLDRLREERDALIHAAASATPGGAALEQACADVRKKQREIRQCLQEEFDGKPDPRFEKAGPAVPCYFNSGCCVYNNGMTALELSNGTIRLVKWNRRTKDRAVYEEDSLRELFVRIKLAE